MSAAAETSLPKFNVDEVRKNFVASISNLDLNRLPSNDMAAELRHLHTAYPVLAISEQDLSAEAFVTVARTFGEIEIDTHVQQFAHPGMPELIYLTNVDKEGNPDPASAGRGSEWHSDSSYKADPCAHTVLYALEVPSKGGGTIFADMYRAYDSLPEDLVARIEGRSARHLFSRGPAAANVIPMTKAQEAAHPQVAQPMVRTHPVTDRKALYVNPLHTVDIIGLDPSESQEILNFLFAHAVQEQFLYHHHWQPGQLVIWDQRCTMHRGEAAYDISERRRLMRAKICAPTE